MFALRRTAQTAAAFRTFSTTAARPLAKMQLIGRLADTPEVMPTSTGRDVIRYALGVSTGPRDENGNRHTSWFRVASFVEGPQRDVLVSLPKGTLLYVEADAKMDTFEVEGQKRTQINILQRNFEALSRPLNRDASAVESNTNAVEEPQSGLGAS